MSRNIYPAVVVYERPSGITQADRVKAAADARAFARVHGVTGPVPSTDGKAIETVVSAAPGKQGWNGAATLVDSIHKIAATAPGGLAVHITGPAVRTITTVRVAYNSVLSIPLNALAESAAFHQHAAGARHAPPKDIDTARLAVAELSARPGGCSE